MSSKQHICHNSSTVSILYVFYDKQNLNKYEFKKCKFSPYHTISYKRNKPFYYICRLIKDFVILITVFHSHYFSKVLLIQCFPYWTFVTINLYKDLCLKLYNLISLIPDSFIIYSLWYKFFIISCFARKSKCYDFPNLQTFGSYTT